MRNDGGSLPRNFARLEHPPVGSAYFHYEGGTTRRHWCASLYTVTVRSVPVYASRGWQGARVFAISAAGRRSRGSAATAGPFAFAATSVARWSDVRGGKTEAGH